MLDVLTTGTGPSPYSTRTLSGEHWLAAFLEAGVGGVEVLRRNWLKLLECRRVAYGRHYRLARIDVVVLRVLRGIVVVVSCHIHNRCVLS